MRTDKLRIEDIKKIFEGSGYFTSKQLYEFYIQDEPRLNINTYRWRVYYLKEQGLIRSIKRGVYTLENKKTFEVNISRNMLKMYNLIKRQLPYTNISIWETVWVHKFMIHQPNSSLIIIDIDKEAMNTAFEILREKMGNVYIYARKNDISFSMHGNSVVIKSFLKESPIKKEKMVIVPKLEKILVDLFVDEGLFITYHGQELINIFNEIFSEYAINMTTLYRYARERAVTERLKGFLRSNVQSAKK